MRNENDIWRGRLVTYQRHGVNLAIFHNLYVQLNALYQFMGSRVTGDGNCGLYRVTTPLRRTVPVVKV